MMKKINIATCLLLLASIATVVISYLAGHSSQRFLFNSDILYLPTLFSDLASGGSIADWYLTPAPYFFPDFIIFYFAHNLGVDTYSRIIIFSVLQIALSFFAIWFLVRQIQPSRAFVVSTTIMIGLIWFSMKSDEPLTLLLASASHYGIFIAGITFVALWMQYKETGNASGKKALGFMMCMLALASIFSDGLFVIQILAPWVITNIIVYITNISFEEHKKKLLLGSLLIVIFGTMCYKIVRHYTRARFSLKIDFSRLNDVYTIFQQVFAFPAYKFVFIVYVGVIICICFALFKNRIIKLYPKWFLWLVLFSCVSACLTLAALMLPWDFPPATRYLIPCFSFPLIVIVLFFALHFRKKFAILSLFITIPVVVSMSVDSYELVANNGLNSRYYPDEIACIDDALENTGLTNGIAGYWDAKSTQNFSRLNLEITQFVGDLEERRWITSKRYFKNSYDFALLSEEPRGKISSDALIELNGNPYRIAVCGSKSIYFYGKGKLQVK
jgi:hypothetical protein